MAETITCPNCAARLQLPGGCAGRMASCLRCKVQFPLPPDEMGLAPALKEALIDAKHREATSPVPPRGAAASAASQSLLWWLLGSVGAALLLTGVGVGIFISGRSGTLEPPTHAGARQSRKVQPVAQPLAVLDEAVGIETVGGKFTPLIDRGAELPASFVGDFSTAEDNQPGVTLHLLAGDDAMAKDARSLGRFHIEKIPPAPRGIPRIHVTLSVDEDGGVRVTARNSDPGDVTAKSIGKVAVKRR